jgi:hypothetical protein
MVTVSYFAACCCSAGCGVLRWSGRGAARVRPEQRIAMRRAAPDLGLGGKRLRAKRRPCRQAQRALGRGGPLVPAGRLTADDGLSGTVAQLAQVRQQDLAAMLQGGVGSRGRRVASVTHTSGLAAEFHRRGWSAIICVASPAPTFARNDGTQGIAAHRCGVTVSR